MRKMYSLFIISRWGMQWKICAATPSWQLQQKLPEWAHYSWLSQKSFKFDDTTFPWVWCAVLQTTACTISQISSPYLPKATNSHFNSILLAIPKIYHQILQIFILNSCKFRRYLSLPRFQGMGMIRIPCNCAKLNSTLIPVYCRACVFDILISQILFCGRDTAVLLSLTRLLIPSQKQQQFDFLGRSRHQRWPLLQHTCSVVIRRSNCLRHFTSLVTRVPLSSSSIS